MNVLGFDTSTAATAACVIRADEAVFEQVPNPAELLARPGHTRELMPAVARLMGEAGLGFGDLDLIGLSLGPGSFTGLRVGAATARGLAHAHGTPVRGVSSLAALAAGAEAPTVLALLDARRGELFAGLFEHHDERWPPFAAAPEELLRRVRTLPDAPLAVGDGSLRFREMLESSGVRVAPEGSPLHVVRALHVCRLSRRVADEPSRDVVPTYLRDPDARPRP